MPFFCWKIAYDDWQGEVIERIIEPYTLVFFNNSWYSKALCHLKNQLRTFALRRIKKAELLKSDFEPNKEIISFGKSRWFSRLWEDKKCETSRCKSRSWPPEIISAAHPSNHPRWRHSGDPGSGKRGTFSLHYVAGRQCQNPWTGGSESRTEKRTEKRTAENAWSAVSCKSYILNVTNWKLPFLQKETAWNHKIVWHSSRQAGMHDSLHLILF